MSSDVLNVLNCEGLSMKNAKKLGVHWSVPTMYGAIFGLAVGFVVAMSWGWPESIVIHPEIPCVVGPNDADTMTFGDGTKRTRVSWATFGCAGVDFQGSRNNRFGLTEVDWNTMRYGSVRYFTQMRRPKYLFLGANDFLTNGRAPDLPVKPR